MGSLLCVFLLVAGAVTMLHGVDLLRLSLHEISRPLQCSDRGRILGCLVSGLIFGIVGLAAALTGILGLLS